MLRKIPDSAVPFARNGVIAASALGQAESAERLLRFAQSRATQLLNDAERQAHDLRTQACQAGYREGVMQALTAAVPALAELLEDEAQLKERVRLEMEKRIRAALTDAGIEAALIAQCCLGESGPGAPGQTWTLYLPEDRTELAARLDAQLPDGALRVRPGQAPTPVLERGDRVIELNTSESALRQLPTWLDEQALADPLRQRALDFAAAVERAVSVKATRTHLAKLTKEVEYT
jgi:hypothetical protein